MKIGPQSDPAPDGPGPVPPEHPAQGAPDPLPPIPKGGRPSKYTPERVEALCHAIGLGLSQKRACELVGIHPDTFRAWRDRPGFSDAVKKAQAGFIARNLATITAASAKSWQAAAWLLERRFPREFARVEMVKAEVRRGEDPLSEQTVFAALPPLGLSREVLAQIEDKVGLL